MRRMSVLLTANAAKGYSINDHEEIELAMPGCIDVNVKCFQYKTTMGQYELI